MAFRKPADYESVSTGEYKVLPAGGYICRIMKAEETKSKDAGKDMLKVAFDICDGEYTGYFMDNFNSRKAAAENPEEVKWPFSGTKWITLLDNEGRTNRDFKAFCKALEDSGVTVWNGDVFNVTGLKNAEVGVIYRREEHEYMNQTSWRTVPFRFRSAKAIESGDFTVPDDKPLSRPFAGTAFEADSFSAAQDDIPF